MEYFGMFVCVVCDIGFVCVIVVVVDVEQCVEC